MRLRNPSDVVATGERPRRASERAQQLNGPTGCMKGGGKQGKKEGNGTHSTWPQSTKPRKARPSSVSGILKMMGWSVARALVNGTFYLFILTKSYASGLETQIMLRVLFSQVGNRACRRVTESNQPRSCGRIRLGFHFGRFESPPPPLFIGKIM